MWTGRRAIYIPSIIIIISSSSSNSIITILLCAPCDRSKGYIYIPSIIIIIITNSSIIITLLFAPYGQVEGLYIPPLCAVSTGRRAIHSLYDYYH